MSVRVNPMKRPRKYEEIAAQLRIFIADRHLSPGVRLPGENQLARALSTTRPTLRSGLRILNVSGEIETRLGAGSYVSNSRKPISIEVVDPPGPMEILKARLTIEPQIAGEAALLADATNLRTMQQILSEMRNATDSFWYDNLYRAFHLSVASAAKQQAIADLIGGLIDAMNSRLTGTRGSSPPCDDLHDHERIFEALQMRSTQATVSAMRNHLQRMQERLFEDRFISSSCKSRADTLRRENMRRRTGSFPLADAPRPSIILLNTR